MSIKITAAILLSASLLCCQATRKITTNSMVGPVGDSLKAAADTQTVAKAYTTGDEKIVDNPADIVMLRSQGKAGTPLATKPMSPRSIAGQKILDRKALDVTDLKRGQFSVAYVVDKKKPTAFGFTPGTYISHWQLDEEFELSFQIKAEDKTDTDKDTKWVLALYDSADTRAEVPMPNMNADGEWRLFTFDLKHFEAAEVFDFFTIKSIQVEAVLSQGIRVLIDDMVFRKGNETLGISDKTITQYMAEAASTLAKRRNEFMKFKLKPMMGSHQFIGYLYESAELDEINNLIIEDAKAKSKKGKYWGLWDGSATHWRLFGYGSMGKIRPHTLSPEAEKATLDHLWKHCLYKNDIATASRSTWNLSGSENHDINSKVENLLSSQLFKNHPDYKDRIYPNLGRMAGYHYGDNPEFNAHGEIPAMKLGSGNYKDGNKYTAEDHYNAWVKFWKEYLRERAKHGFFVEHNSNGYMLHTLRFLHHIYAWCEDQELRTQARMFLDLVWAQFAQDQNMLLQGGSTTRGTPGLGRMSSMAEYFLGGPAGLGRMYTFSDYQWPRAVWEMVLDRKDMGEYAFISRKPHEVRDQFPREPGSEYTILARHDSRIKRYSWVTPDYVMGTRLDHPTAIYHHLGVTADGITFPTRTYANIIFDPGRMNYLSVQDRNVALMVHKRYSLWRSPEWFPGLGPWEIDEYKSRIVFGKDIKNIVEKEGWVFVKEGNAYVAIRMLAPVSEGADTEREKLEGTMEFAVTTVYDQAGFGIYKPALKPYVMKKGKAEPRVP